MKKRSESSAGIGSCHIIDKIRQIAKKNDAVRQMMKTVFFFNERLRFFFKKINFLSQKPKAAVKKTAMQVRV